MEESEPGESIPVKDKGAKKGGRPALDSSLKVHKLFNVYGTITEGEQIAEEHKLYAYGRKISLSDFVKERLIPSAELRGKDSTKRRYSVVELNILGQIRIDLGSILSSLKSLSSNYNQSTKRINSLPVSGKMAEEIRLQSKVIAESQQVQAVLNELLDRLNSSLTNKDLIRGKGKNGRIKLIKGDDSAY